MGPLCFASALPPALFFAMTALISPDQYHAHASRCFPNHSYAGALLSRTVPLRRKSMLCQNISKHRQCVSEQTIAVAEPLNAQALRLNALLYQCSATPQPRYSVPLRHSSNPQLIIANHCHDNASLCLCPSHQLRFVALPCFAFSRRFTTLACRVNSMPLHFTATASISIFFLLPIKLNCVVAIVTQFCNVVRSAMLALFERYWKYRAVVLCFVNEPHCCV